MEATFFKARRDDALRAASQEDLSIEPAGEPVRVESMAWLLRLSELLGLAGQGFGAPLRDTTCRSFPLWQLPSALIERLADLDDDALDVLAEAWHDESQADADLYELGQLLVELREALQTRGDDEALYLLVEEKAL